MLKFQGGRGRKHFETVTRHSIELYDCLEPIHRLPTRYRTVLWAAAMLHDIGTDSELGKYPKSHAWRSAAHILEKDIQCDLASAIEIATVASLHRREGGTEGGALGAVYPPILALLMPNGIPDELLKISSILRVADGLDRYHPTTVTGFRLEGSRILVSATGDEFQASLAQAREKSAMLTEMLALTVDVEYLQAEDPALEKERKRRAIEDLTRSVQ
jgi:exopolyphosphatase/pppGpp-phosphohydrolase